jgi:hypothetical protein
MKPCGHKASAKIQKNNEIRGFSKKKKQISQIVCVFAG